jgi:hypothetical protein
MIRDLLDANRIRAMNGFLSASTNVIWEILSAASTKNWSRLDSRPYELGTNSAA